MSKQSDTLDELKKAILLNRAKQRMAKPAETAGGSTLGRADRNGELPLSYAQQRLWFLDQLDATAGVAYLVPAALRLSGQLDRAALRKTLDRIVARHENLRTSFVERDGAPQPLIAPETTTVLLAEHDLRELDTAVRDAQVAAFSEDEAQTPFHLAQGPLMRARLLRLADDEHVLLVTLHHIISDGWSLGVLVREVSALYTAFSQGQADPLPPLAIQHVDYVAWQRSPDNAARLQQGLAYWQQRLAGVPLLHELPLDRARPAVQGFRAQRHLQQFDATLLAALRQWCRRSEATLFMALQSVFAALLARWSGRSDIVVGTPVAGRLHKDAEALIGFFNNTLACRFEVDASRSATQLLAQGKFAALEDLANQQVPFDLLVETLRPERSLAYNPLCQIKFVLQNFETGELKLPGLKLAPVDQGSERLHFDLDLTVSEAETGLYLSWTYKDELFDRASIEGLAQAYGRLLQQVVAQPELPLDQLDWLDEGGVQALRVQGQGPASAANRELPLPRQIEQQAQRTPDAIAVRCGDRSLSYAQLDARASRLAQALIEQGVTPRDRVGVHLERSIELMIALLAVMKSGAAYVMLDHKQVPERLQAILGDAGIGLVLLDSRRSVLPVAGVDTLFLDDAVVDADWLAEYPATSPALAIAAEDSAYVLYTSGSTGTPKGVEILHRGLTDYCAFAREGYYAESLTGSLVVTSPAFDLTVPSLYVPLLTGGCVELISAEEDLAGLVARLEQPEAKPVLLRLTPSHLQALLQLADETPRTTAHVFVIGGEAFGVDLARELQAKYPRAQIYNHYGPTETVVGCCWYDVTANLATLDRTIPIGRPMSNTAIYVLDAQGKLQPPGVAGELYIGGAGVAKGYLNQPELTAEKFVVDPFNSNERIYRSGDRVRWRSDGQLEFLGRLDDQVKLRGFRIELGDIESALRRQANVREAVAVVKGEGGDARLVAYVVTSGADGVDAIRTAVAEQLPSYMQPSAYVVLDQLPLTPNGKVDRNALPEPERQAQAFVEPQGETETTLAAIWARVLKLEAISRDANFFELGGHSLLATRVVSEIGRTFGKPVPVRALFEHPQLAQLAAHVDAQARSGYTPIPVVARDAALPLSFAQQRLWFIDRLEGGSAQYNLPVSLRLHGDLEFAALQQALDALVARHEVLRTTYAEVDGVALQTVRPATPVSIVVEDLRGLAVDAREASLQQLARAEALRGFDLSRDPMLRCCLVQLEQVDNALLFTMHHIASDGWSLGVLVQEFVALYAGIVAGRPATLPALRVQYADYAAWQRERLQGATLRLQLDYWRRQLAGLPVLHGLPLDKPRPAQQCFDGGRIDLELDADTMAALNALARRHESSLFMLLQAAFAVLLSRWSGESDIVIGTPVAGRLHPDVEPLIGFFINTLVLRSDLSGDPTFDTLLAQSRATALAAYEHQEIPFEMLVDELKPVRSLSHTPLIQVMLTLQNNEQTALELPGLSLVPMAARHEQLKFDLQLVVSESPRGLRLTWLYAQSLFLPQTAERLAQGLLCLLSQIVQQPQRRLSELEWFDAAETRAVLAQCAGKACTQHLQQLLAQQFSAQAKRTPDAVAVIFGSESLSYRELDQKSDRLARYLLATGLEPEARVGLYLPRSPELLIGLFGVLKAGGAYVPLEPELPAERIAYQIHDAGIQCVLLTGQALQKLPLGGVDVVLMDQAGVDTDWLDDYADGAIDVAVTADSLAYVLYTSGTTGKPKGVMVTQRGLSNYLAHTLSDYLPGMTGAVVSSPLCFDATLTSLLPPLLAGKPVELLADDDGVLEALASRLLQAERPWLFKITPAHLDALAYLGEHGEPCAAAHCIVVGGEQLTTATMRLWTRLLPNAVFVNEYGPTETVVGCSVYAVSGAASLAGLGHAVPIGRPIRNTQLYVLNEGLHLQPVGSLGELYIGGDGVARGYLNREALTAERFVRDPFSADANACLYRTGDLVRWLPSGELEFIGRRDQQVKLRGFRIELGEIEAALLVCSGVREAVALVREDEPGEKRLVAYVVAQPGAEPTVASLREQLARSLADYMIPGAFVRLDTLPLTTNGKVDRRALPAPDGQITQAYVAPTSEAEAKLAAIWQQVLRRERIGIHDNFFEIGGDSILSIQVTSRANQAGIAITTRQLFEAQTIAALAQCAQPQRAIEHPQGEITGALTLLPIQQQFLSSDVADKHHHNQAVLLQVPAQLSADALRTVVAALYRRHDALRLRFREQGGQWQATHPAFDETMLDVSCVVEALPEASGAIAGFLNERCNHWQASFDLAQGPLLRVVLFQGAEQSRLLLLAHHLVIDGVSWRILLADLETAYRQLERGEAVVLAPKTSSLQQWGEALAAHAQSPQLAQERAYWLAQYRLPVPPLPVDHATADGGEMAQAAHVGLRLDAEDTRALLQQCNRAYRTQINELLLAGVYLGLRRWSGEKGLRIALEGHGREALSDALDLTQTLGWFTSIYPLTLWHEQASVEAVIKGTKEQYRAVPERGIGYGVLRHLAQDAQLIEAEAGQWPELAFNYLGQSEQAVNEDTFFQGSSESAGASQSPRRRRAHALVLKGMVAGGELRLSLEYGRERYERASMETLAAQIETALREIVEHCATRERAAFTPSDFPLAQVDQAQLDQWQQQYPALTRLYPATAMQAGLLFESLIEVSSYIIQTFPILRGELDTAAFRRAWQQVVDRHDIFRTAFVGEGEGLHQLVSAGAELPWHEEDWGALDAAEQERRFETYRANDKQTAFDFAAAPLMRVALFHLGANRYQLLWTLHHMLSDGWSSPLVYRDVIALYQAQLQNRPASLPVPQPYEQHIAWLQRQDREAARAHWHAQLGEVDTPSMLVMDRLPTDGEQGHREHFLELTPAQTDNLQAAAKAQRSTVNTLVQWAWAYLLHRYSGDTEVVFGATISGRPAQVPGVEEMVGLFINTVPVRIAFDGQRSIAATLATLQQEFQRSNDYGYLSLTEIQRQSRVRAGTPLFDTLLGFVNYPLDAMTDVAATPAAARLQIERASSNEISSYTLDLNAHLGRSLRVRFVYRAERFAQATVARLAAQLGEVLQQLPAALAQDLRHIDLLDAAQKQQLTDWSAPPRVAGDAGMLAQQFSAQAKRTPDAVAVIFGSESLSYRELDQKSDRLARYLLATGLEPEARVGLYLPRSPELLIGLFGVLKAGGAYVPLEPELPAERIAYQIHDAGIQCVLLTGQALQKLPLGGVDVVLMDQAGVDTDWLDDYADGAIDVAVTADSLAYVLYTSGTTGKPKGVMVTQRGLSNYLAHTLSDYLPGMTGAVVSSPLCFDATLTSLLPPLLAGKPVELLADDDSVLEALASRLLQAERPWLFKITPAHLDALAYLGEHAEPCQAAHCIVVGGEQLTTATMRLWTRLLPNAVFVNEYGPTETVVGCSVYSVSGAASLAGLGHAVPIGRPIRNTQLYVLNEGLRLQPVGSLGELYIGGDGVARGYLNREALTAERFVRDPFSADANARLYRTGDLVRWLPSGELEFIGRRDQQVKLRGFRIELGEIEAALLACSGVREAVALVREDEPGEKRLVAYVVAQPGAEPTVASLREQLARSLADYMIPGAFVRLDTLPLTTNGKVDRRALPAPDQIVAEYQPPQGDTEIRLAEIWQRVLKLDRVGRDADFFELGGHSLLATRALSEISRSFGTPLPIRTLFEQRRLWQLAACIAAQTQRVYTAIPRVPREQPLPLSYTQQRLWFVAQLDAAGTHYHMPLALRLHGALDRAALQQALDTLLLRHEVLRTCFADVDGAALQTISPPTSLAMAQTDLRDVAEAARETALQQLQREDARKPFDLGRGPLLRCALVQLGDTDHALLLTLHHIIADGWSLGVLVREFAALYGAAVAGQAAVLPPLAIQYADYAAWQRGRLQGETVRQQLDYWRQQLAGLPLAHNLPLDRPRPAQQRFAGARLRQDLDAATLAGLTALARRHDASLFMLLQAAFALLVARWSGETDIAIGTPIAGRLHPDVEPLIGCFINTLVLRSDVSGDPTVAELLARSRNTALAAYEHQEIPFEMLVDELKPARSLAHAPLFQLLFTLQNNEQTALELPGLSVAPLGARNEQTKFDLQLTAAETAQGLWLSWSYAQSLFDAATVERLAAAYAQLLQQLWLRPQARLSELEWLDAEATQSLRTQGQGATSTRHREMSLPQQIARQAWRTPEAIAVRCGDQSLSYAQLDARANRLAQALSRRSLGRGTRVGVHLERSVELMIALLAVQKSGAAYVMLDHRQTPERLQAIIADAGLSLVLLDSRRSALPTGGVDTVLLDDAAVDADWLAEYPATDPGIAVAPEDSAYVLYTSGSTGTPKGVEILHRGLTDYCAFAREGYYAESLTGSLVVTSPAFDLTVPSLYVPLLTGGCVELISAEEDLAGLVIRLERPEAKAVLLRLTPSHLQALLQLADAQPRNAAHVFVVGGEAFGVDLARELQAKYPRAQIYNHYGPTETVVGCCWYDVTANLATLERTIPIGRPMSNTQLYVLDAQGKLQPPGVAGELYIGGAGVAKGYLNQPELTAEKFVADPFNSRERVYRSGDRVRWRSDGQLEFLGRLDDQVKLRGFRIELGDIESALRRHGNVRDAVAVVKGEGSEARLLAYVVAEAGDESALIDALKSQLMTQLPSYMQPSGYVVLPRLPLTPNGKVDKAALPEPVLQQALYVEAQTPTEQRLAAIWCEVLGLGQVSVTANFFDIGGHSLLATRLISAVRRELEVEVSIRLIFDRSDIRSIAKLIDEQEIRRRNQAMVNTKDKHVELEW